MSGANQRQVGGDHYSAAIQHWDLIERHGIGYLEGCATKYLTRWCSKGGLQDLQKAEHYTQKLIELHEEGVRVPRGIVPMKALTEFLNANAVDVVERGAIHLLLRWDCLAHLEEARKDIRSLIASAEVVPAIAHTE